MDHRPPIDYFPPITAYRSSDAPRRTSCYMQSTNSDFSSSLPRCSVGKFRKQGESVIWNPYNKNVSCRFTVNLDGPLGNDRVNPGGIVFSSQRIPSITSDTFVSSIPEQRLSQRLNFDISTVLKHAEIASKPPSRGKRHRFSFGLLMRKTPDPKSIPTRCSTMDGYTAGIFMRSAADYQPPEPPKPKKHGLLRRIRARKNRGQLLLESSSIHSAPAPTGQMNLQGNRSRSCYSAPPPRIDNRDRRNDDLYIKFMSD